MPAWYGGSTLNPDQIVPGKDQWRIQWERTKRWFRRVQSIHQKSLDQMIDPEDEDSVIAFFLNCYHLRDWIRSSHPELNIEVATLFKQNFELGACRDICNGFKHKTLTTPSHDANFNWYWEYDYLDLMGKSGRNPHKNCIAFQDGTGIRKFNLFDLATHCFSLWEGFLKGHKLE